MARVGFIGLGNKGGGMAANLAENGHDVRAFDLSAEALERAKAAGCLPAASADMPMGARAVELYATFAAEGQGGLDFSAIIKIPDQWLEPSIVSGIFALATDRVRTSSATLCLAFVSCEIARDRRRAAIADAAIACIANAVGLSMNGRL